MKVYANRPELAKSPLLGMLCWMKPRGLDSLIELVTPKEIKQYYAFITESVTQRMKAEREAEELDENERRQDMFHYLFQNKNPDTNEPAYGRQELKLKQIF